MRIDDSPRRLIVWPGGCNRKKKGSVTSRHLACSSALSFQPSSYLHLYFLNLILLSSYLRNGSRHRGDHQTALTAGGTQAGKAVWRGKVFPLPPSPHSRGPTEPPRRFVSRFAVRTSVWWSSRVEFQRASLGVAGASTRRTHARTHGVHTSVVHRHCIAEKKSARGCPFPPLPCLFFRGADEGEVTRRKFRVLSSTKVKIVKKVEKIFGYKMSHTSFRIKRVRRKSRNSLENHCRRNSLD